MQDNLKLAVIGGTGKSGKYLVRQLLNRGFSFKLLLRNPENFEINSPLIEVIRGDARNYEAVRALLEGSRAVISTLGQPKGETPIFSEATANVLRSMKECRIKRYILITGLNVDTPFDKKGAKAAFATEWMKANYSATTADKQSEWRVLSESDIDWTLVRLPLIELTDKTGKIGISLEDCPGEKISAADLANFLIGQLTESLYWKQAPFIASL